MKSRLTTAAAFLLALCFNSCNNAPSENKKETETSNGTSKAMEGISIVDQNCISCHSPKADSKGGVAPTLLDIKKHYMREGMTEAQFAELMSTFLSSPSMENSQMPHAVEKYGIMPNLGFSTDQYKSVASYLYNADLKQPNWYEQHKKSKANMAGTPTNGEMDYLKKGKEIALSTKAVLGKNLLTAIQNKGTDKALEFCNTRAIPLTDSMASILHASVKRVSDNNRNPDNLANPTELEYIRKAKQQIAESGKATPEVHEEAGKMIGYYPIMTNAMCLQCHGKPQVDINENTLAALQNLYPDDKATGYGENQLRGIWVIEMDK